MAEGQVYDIPEGGLEWLREKISGLSRKIEKLGGEPIYLTVVGFHYEENDNFANRVRGTVKRKIWEVFLAVPEIKLADWEFVGRIDHTRENGNILRSLTSEDLPHRFRDCDPGCDHCNTNRRRRDTFVVRHTETQEYRQVGTSCLKDFTGHEDAARLAKLAELASNVSSMIQYSRSSMGWTERDYMVVEDYCYATASVILSHGWVSKAQAKRSTSSTATADRARYLSILKEDAPARELAESALEWARNLGPEDDLNDYEHNIRVLANSECIELHHYSMAASIVGTYYMKFRKDSGAAHSQFQGEIGEKISRYVKLVQVQQLDNSTRHRFMDREGNIYTWFASNGSLRDRVDTCFRISAKVKAHNSFRGESQTIISHVQVS